ncbi:MAG: TolC family protein [Vampirovibrionales bacterium]|nr:TolC family protein [Vampirovibrionales bacterium]
MMVKRLSVTKTPAYWPMRATLCALALGFGLSYTAWAASPPSNQAQVQTKVQAQTQSENSGTKNQASANLPVALEPLQLNDVLTRVRTYHPKLLGATLERNIAAAKALEKQGAFDPVIRGDSEFLRYNDFIDKGKVSETWDNEAVLSYTNNTGIKLESGYRFNTGDVKPPLYPTGTGGEYFMGLKMPLLRGLIINEKSVALQQAELGIPKADAELGVTRLDVLKAAAEAYWQWVGAGQKRIATQKMLAVAQFRVKAVKTRSEAGELPAIDISEAEQEIFRRQGQLAKAQRELEKATFKLAQYLWQPDGTPDAYVPEARLPEKFTSAESLIPELYADARLSAIKQRPEIRSLNLEQKIITLDKKLADTQRLPVLDAYIVPGMDTGENSIGFTVKTGVQLIVPLRQRTASGQIQAARFKLQKLDLSQRLLLQKILIEVDDAVSAIQAAQMQLGAAQNEAALAETLQDGERTRFDLGDSTLFLLNQRERAALEAQLKVIDERVGLEQAWVQFKAASAAL